VRSHAQASSAGSINGNGHVRGLLSVVVLALFAILAFGTASASAAAPTVTIDPSPTGHYTTVEVKGTVNPENNPGGVAWHYEFTTTPADPFSWIGANGGFIEAPESEGTTPIAVPATIEGLTPGSTYSVRLVAENFIDSAVVSPEATFTTSPVSAPTVSLEPITTKTDTTALFKGKVDPNSPGGLDDAGKAAYLTHWQFHCNPACPGLEENEIEAEAGEQNVEFHATGLEPSTFYEVTITGRNADGEVSDGPQTFSTDEIAPTVNAASGSALGNGKFQLAGTVNPHNSEITSCIFEYGPDTSYGHTAPCETNPGAVNKPVFVTASVSDLAIGTEYHFRLTAANGAGPISSDDVTFTPNARCPNEAIREEQGSSFLPECRAWEQVSPTYKEGFLAGEPRQYSDGGDRVIYQSNGNFAENGLGDPFNHYLAARSATGWITEGVNPFGPQYAMSTSAGVATVFSPDLRTGLFQMARSDQSIDTVDFYLRDAEGAFSRIGPVADPATLPPSSPGGSSVPGTSVTPAASADLSRIAFARTVAGGSRVFEYTSAGEAEPVDLDNSDQPLGSACVEGFGSGDSLSPKAISDDGRVLVWTRSCGLPLGRDLYARVGHITVAVSSSHCDRAPSDPAGPCIGGEPDAQFVGTSADGSVAYFISSNQLVNEDTDQTPDLYACDLPSGEPAPVGQFNPCDSLTQVSKASEEAEVEGALAVSEDGTHVYFTAHGVLSLNSGANGETAATGANNLYLWQRDPAHPQGEVTFLSRLSSSDQELWSYHSTTQAQSTSSGRFLLLPSSTALVANGPQADTDGGAVDVYRYDAESGEFTRVSTDSAAAGGNQGNANAGIIGGLADLRSTPAYRSHPAMSSDGQSVVFSTPEQLSPFDRNETVDVYVWHEDHVALISSGRVSSDEAVANYRPRGSITPDGRNVFFNVAVPLVATDTDTVTDLYDARVNGGFPAPASSVPCTGESSCRAPSTVSPAPQAPSTTASTAGNPAPSPRCAKGKVRKHGRCVKHHGRTRVKRHHHGKNSDGKGRTEPVRTHKGGVR
jgi:hypothetical protein